MDLTESIAPRSDQLNAEDLLTGPRTFTIENVTAGNVEQPVNVHLVEFPGRPFKPSKTVRRIMVAAWGKDSAAYTGKRMTLYRDPTVRFGGQDVGGIRVSHMSGIDKRIVVALTVTRGKRAPYTVEPLPDAAAGLSEAEIAAADDQQQLREWWNANPNMRAVIEARVAELNAPEPQHDHEENQ
jgi:hypothetical protein